MENWITEEFRNNLHLEIEKIIGSNVNVDIKASTIIGPNQSKYKETDYHSHFYLRTNPVQGCSDGQTFVVTHHEHNSQLEIFIANVSYFYFDNPMNGSEVVAFVKEKSKKTWL